MTLITASGREGEARLAVSCHILSDIVLNPGSIDFGAVARGQAPTQVLTIDRINAADWRFVRMVSASRALTRQLVETARSGGSVSYTLKVSLKPDAPAGPLRDELRLVSNDPETPSIPIMVSGIDSRWACPPRLRCCRSARFTRPRERMAASSIRGLAAFRHPVDRRCRRRVLDFAPRSSAAGNPRRDGRLQARRGDDSRRHPSRLSRAYRLAG